MDPQFISFQHNISKNERQAINESKNNSDIITKQSDKGGGWIIMDKFYYEDQIIINGHLNSITYKLTDDNSDQEEFTKLKK